MNLRPMTEAEKGQLQGLVDSAGPIEVMRVLANIIYTDYPSNNGAEIHNMILDAASLLFLRNEDRQ